jgi:hypothetical protein
MDNKEIISIIDELHHYAKHSDLDMIIVGSVAYTYDCGRIETVDQIELNDIDCVFVYSDLDQLKRNPLISEQTVNYFSENKGDLALDLLAVKKMVNSIIVSADFVSVEYLKQLAHEPYNGTSFYRKKLNDSIESPSNDYYDFAGNMHLYIKPHEKTSFWNIYTLPTKLYLNGIFFPGVLLNKFIHSPILDYVANQEILAHCAKIFQDFFDNARAICRTNQNYDITKAVRHFDRFCDRAKRKILDQK